VNGCRKEEIDTSTPESGWNPEFIPSSFNIKEA